MIMTEKGGGLTIGIIKDISGRSFKAGERLFEDGSVTRVRVDRHVLKGRVLDGIVYSIAIPIGDSSLYCNCICSSSPENLCRHGAAVLLYTLRNLKKISQYWEHHGNVADYLLEGLEDDKDDFMPRNMKYSKKSFRRLLDRLGDKYIQIYIDCLDDVDHMFYDLEVAYGVWTTEVVDFTVFFDKISQCKRDKNYPKAARICQAVSEGIAFNIHNVDDSSAYHADVFTTMLKEMVSVIHKAKFDHLQKRQYISYLYDQFMYNEPDYLNEFYEEALKTVCTTKKDHEYWRTLHEHAIPRKLPSHKLLRHSGYSSLVEMQAYILERLDDPSLVDLYEEYYRQSSTICEMYIKMLSGTDKTKMQKIRKEMPSLFPQI